MSATIPAHQAAIPAQQYFITRFNTGTPINRNRAIFRMNVMVNAVGKRGIV